VGVGFKKFTDLSADVVEQIISDIVNGYFKEESAQHNAINVETKIESVSETDKSFKDFKEEIEN